RPVLRHPAERGRRIDDHGERARDHPHAAGQAGGGQARRQPHLVSRAAVQNTVQALEGLCVGDPGLDHRIHHWLHRRGHGHRRRVPAGADADLLPAHPDGDRHRHLDGAYPRHHGVGDRDACGDQPSGRRGAGADPDGRRRRRRAIRCARRAEHAWRTAAPAARRAGVRGRLALRLPAHRAAGRPLLAAFRWGCVMLRRLLPALVLASLVAPEPVRAERLVTSLSSHQVSIASNFTGTDVVLFGSVERDAASVPRRSGYDIVVTVLGPRQTVVTRVKGRVLGIWANVDSREFIDAPSYLAVLSTNPILSVANTETLRRLQVGLANFALPQRIGGKVANILGDDPFRAALIRIKAERGLYLEEPKAVTFLTPALFRTSIPLPAEAPIGTYDVDV